MYYKKYELYTVCGFSKNFGNIPNDSEYFYLNSKNNSLTFYHYKQENDDDNMWFYKNYFITLKELRKQKLNKLKNLENVENR